MKKNLITEELFNKETNLCKQLSEENNGKCCWGNCENCGVIPFLYKLYKGEVIDDEDKIKELKKRFLK